MSLVEKTLKVALSQLGVEEKPKGSNSGPEVNEYLKSVGLSAGYSWCMAFVYWCILQACKELQPIVSHPLYKTGGVLKMWQQCVAYQENTPSVGSIFIMDLGKGMGHTGFVESFDTKYIYTIEGNTNELGSREGYQVAKRKRLRSSIKGYLKFN